jgi:N-acetylneuraminic acid mutarotase
MKKRHLSCCLLGAVISLSASAQTSVVNEWAWMGGSSTLQNCAPYCVSANGVYGTLGVPTAKNVPGGRQNAATWTDKNGNFWLFGGSGSDSVGGNGNLNDLWEFNPSTQQWTWMGGSSRLPFPSNGSQGLPGVYGTLGIPASTNIPGGRTNAVSWTDKNGNFWLFGGEGYATVNGLTGNVFFNDLWEYTPSTNEWTWMGGENETGNTTTGQSGVYGTLGIAAAQNIPGGRYAAVGWIDSSGNLWLFGGAGFDSTGSNGDLNDLWEFNPSTNEWTWMGGSSTLVPGYGGRAGVYGTLGVPAVSNVPGGRDSAMGWTDSSGNFWLFGGQGYDSGITDPNNAGSLNDLWKFDPSSNEWAWMGGSNTLPCNSACGRDGVYGTLGIPSGGNMPGGRDSAIGWTDNSGNFWLFGGEGFASTGPSGLLTDLWKFTPSTNEWVWMGGPTTVGTCIRIFVCGWPGVYGALGVPSTENIPGSRDKGESWIDHEGDLWLLGGYGDDSIGNVGGLNDLWVFQPIAGTLPAATPTFSAGTGTYTSDQTVQILNTTPGATIYYTNDGTLPTAGSMVYSNSITVSSTETLRAIAIANGYSNSVVANATYTFNPPVDFSIAASQTSLTVAAGQSGKINISVTPLNGFNSAVTLSCSGLPSGASCSFSPTTVTPSGGTASPTLTITVPSATIALHRQPLFPVAVLIASLCCFGLRRSRYLQRLLLLTVSVIGLSQLTGCSGAASSSSMETAPHGVTSTITVTATTGSLQHSTTFLLTVN